MIFPSTCPDVPCEINLDTVRRHPHSDRDGDVPATHAVIIHVVEKAVTTGRNFCQCGICQTLAIVIERRQPGLVTLRTQHFRQAGQALDTGTVRTQLRRQVALHLPGTVGRGHYHLQHLVNRLTRTYQQRGRNDQSLFLELARHRHGPRTVCADVCMVRAVCDEPDTGTVHEDRRDQGHVRQMRTAQIRVIDDQRIARLPGPPAHQVAHCIRHAAQVDRDMGRLGTQLTAGIEHRAGKIQAVPDIGRKGGTPQHCTHFVTHGGQPAAEDTQFNCIHRGHPAGLPAAPVIPGLCSVSQCFFSKKCHSCILQYRMGSRILPFPSILVTFSSGLNKSIHAAANKEPSP